MNQTVSPKPRTHMALFLGSLAVLVLVSCIYGFNQRDNVREAALRGSLATPNSTWVLFVSFYGRDPGQDFLNRFTSDRFVVRKLSDAIRRQRTSENVGPAYQHFDKSTGRVGMPVTLGSVRWLGPFRAKVTIDTPNDGLDYTLIRTTSGWKVIKHDLTWIS